MEPSPAAVVLAAGLGKRMGSTIPKVLLPAAGRPLLAHVLGMLRAAGVERVVVVEGPASPRPSESFAGPGVAFVVQAERLGTGHAVLQARAALDGFHGAILIVHGDMPLVSARSVASLCRARRDAGCHGALLAARVADDPAWAGLGRVFVDGAGCVERMAEARDLAAHPGWGRTELVNVGAYLLGTDGLWEALAGIGRDNVQGEHYLPDVVQRLRSSGRLCVAVMADDVTEALGVNTPDDLRRVEAELLRRASAGED